jgi:hypothetical protein
METLYVVAISQTFYFAPDRLLIHLMQTFVFDISGKINCS